MNVGDELAQYVNERLNYSRSMISEHFHSVPYKNYWVGYTQALADVWEQHQKLVADYCEKDLRGGKKNEHYYLSMADDAICDAIFYLHCASITAVGADADIQDRAISTLIRALQYSRNTISKIGAYTYEKNN